MMRRQAREVVHTALGMAMLAYGAADAVARVILNTGKRVLGMTTPAHRGVENILKCVDGLLAAAASIQKAGSDGWQVTDAGLVIRDRAAMDKMADAFDAVPKIGAELSDLDFGETMQLAGSIVPRLTVLVPKR